MNLAGRVVGIVRVREPGRAAGVVPVLRDSGLGLVEVSLTTPDALAVVACFRDDPELTIGAGTVLTAAQARDAQAAGARFLVTPAVAEAVLATAEVPVLCGAYTATEVARAVELGAAAVKLFPASAGGPGYLRALRDPFPDVLFVPVGGVAVEDVPAWFAAGAVAVGIGGPLVGDGTDLAAIAARARRLRALSPPVGPVGEAR